MKKSPVRQLIPQFCDFAAIHKSFPRWRCWVAHACVLISSYPETFWDPWIMGVGWSAVTDVCAPEKRLFLTGYWKALLKHCSNKEHWQLRGKWLAFHMQYIYAVFFLGWLKNKKQKKNQKYTQFYIISSPQFWSDLLLNIFFVRAEWVTARHIVIW